MVFVDEGENFKIMIVLCLPLIFLFFNEKLGNTEISKSVVYMFLSYFFIILLYLAYNDGKAESPQVIGDDFHFSTSLNEPVTVGDWSVFWDGINWLYKMDIKKKVVVVPKDSWEKVGQNFYIRALVYRRRYYEIPEDAKKVFRSYKLSIEKIAYGTVSRSKLSKDPSVLFYEDVIARLNDENEANRLYAQAKLGDLDSLMVKLSQWSNSGAKKSLITAMWDKVKPKEEEKQDV